MSEIDIIMNDVREIKWHQGSIDGSLKLLLRANKDKLLPSLIRVFGRSKRRVEIYLAIDGKKTVGELASELGMKAQNVSTEITILKEEVLVEIKKITRENEFIYMKTELEKIFHISRELIKKFGLNNE